MHDPMCPMFSAEHPYVGARCRCILIDQVRAEMRAGWDADVEWANKLLDERDEARLEALNMRTERDCAHIEIAALREEVAHAWAVANGEARR